MMKAMLTFSAMFLVSLSFAQSNIEASMLSLSNEIFRFETERKIDSLANLFDDKVVIVSSSGMTRSKNDYLADLKMGRPVHNSIDIQEASASVVGSTAIVVGKGIFVVTISSNKSTYHLSYMEEFLNDNQTWKLIALHASRLSN